MKRFISLILAIMLLVTIAAPAALADSYKDAYSYVVRIYAEEYITIYDADTGEIYGTERIDRWIGTGFAVGEIGQPVKYFVTNRHVAAPEIERQEGTVEGVHVIVEHTVQPYIIYSNSTEQVPANVFAVSDRCDLAVLSLDQPTDKRTPAYIQSPLNSDDILHETVYAAGFPGISDNYDNNSSVISLLKSYETDLTITSGLANTIKQDTATTKGEAIQHTAKISGGNSGGPLTDAKGYVVGVNYGHWVADGDYGLAVSANELTRFLDQEFVPYTTVAEYTRHQIIKYALIGAAAIVVLVAAALVAIKFSKNNKPAANSARRVLVCKEGALKGRSIEIKGTMNIGCDASRCQIIFPTGTPGVSRLHCSVKFDGKVVTVTDENSSHGTWIDQTRLTPGTPVVMHRGQTLYLGSKKQTLTLGS